jgi:hypothetical protein
MSDYWDMIESCRKQQRIDELNREEQRLRWIMDAEYRVGPAHLMREAEERLNIIQKSREIMKTGGNQDE